MSARNSALDCSLPRRRTKTIIWGTRKFADANKRLEERKPEVMKHETEAIPIIVASYDADVLPTLCIAYTIAATPLWCSMYNVRRE